MTTYNEFLLTKASMDVLCEMERLEQTPASEGFILDFNHEYKSNMQAISNCIKELNQAIREANPSKINQCCDKGIKLCEDFRAKIKALPPSKFTGVQNLMPFFVMGLSVLGIASTFGLPLNKMNIPENSLEWTNKFADLTIDMSAKQYPDDPLTRKDLVELGALKQNHSDKGGGAPILDIMGNVFGFFTSHNGLAMKLAMAAPQIKGLLDRIMNFTKECKYAKMIRDEDRFDPNAGNRKYAATLGQIDDTIDMFKAIKSKSRELAGNVKASMIETKNAQEAFLFSTEWKRQRAAKKVAKQQMKDKGKPFYQRKSFINDILEEDAKVSKAAYAAGKSKVGEVAIPLDSNAHIEAAIMKLINRAAAIVKALPEYKAYVQWCDAYVNALDEDDKKVVTKMPSAFIGNIRPSIQFHNEPGWNECDVFFLSEKNWYEDAFTETLANSICEIVYHAIKNTHGIQADVDQGCLFFAYDPPKTSAQESITPQRAAIEAFFFGGSKSPRQKLEKADKKLGKQIAKQQAKAAREQKHAEFKAIDALWGEMDDHAEKVEDQLRPIIDKAIAGIKPDAAPIRKTVQMIADKAVSAALSAGPTRQWLTQFQQMLDEHEMDAEKLGATGKAASFTKYIGVDMVWNDSDITVYFVAGKGDLPTVVEIGLWPIYNAISIACKDLMARIPGVYGAYSHEGTDRNTYIDIVLDGTRAATEAFLGVYKKAEPAQEMKLVGGLVGKLIDRYKNPEAYAKAKAQKARDAKIKADSKMSREEFLRTEHEPWQWIAFHMDDEQGDVVKYDKILAQKIPEKLKPLMRPTTKKFATDSAMVADMIQTTKQCVKLIVSIPEFKMRDDAMQKILDEYKYDWFGYGNPNLRMADVRADIVVKPSADVDGSIEVNDGSQESRIYYNFIVYAVADVLEAVYAPYSPHIGTGDGDEGIIYINY